VEIHGNIGQLVEHVAVVEEVENLRLKKNLC
jgi:hypothetical protein